MSILIKGMEMPKNCAYCRFLQSNGEIFKRELFCGLDSTNDIHGYKPNKGCPLVPVPPHGRLIDADALLSQYEGNIWTAKTDYAEGLRDVVADIKAAPTIIQAEEDEV